MKLKYIIAVKDKKISAFVQKELFKLGYHWQSNKTGEEGKVQNLTKKFLVISKDKQITFINILKFKYDNITYKKINIIDLWTNNLTFKL